MPTSSQTLTIPTLPAYWRALLAFALTAAFVIGGMSVIAAVTRPEPVHGAHIASTLPSPGEVKAEVEAKSMADSLRTAEAAHP